MSYIPMLANDQQYTMRTSDASFYLAYILWTILVILNSSFYASYIQGTIFLFVRTACLVLLLFSELTRMHFSAQSIIGVIIACIFSYAILTAHESILLDIVAFVFCSRDRDFRRIARIGLVLTSCLVTFIVISSFIGIIRNYSGWSGGRMRSYLGFLYALFPAQYLYLITCLAIFLLGNNIRLRNVIILICANYLIYYFTNSRLSFLSSIALIFFSWGIAHFHRKHSSEAAYHIPMVLQVLAALSFVLSALGSLLLTACYDPSVDWMSQLNGVSLLGGRLSIGQQWLRSYPIQLFGRELHFTGAALDSNGVAGSFAQYDTIDSLYVRMLVTYGLVFTLLFIALFTSVTVRAIRSKNIFLIVILVSIALHCTIDNLSLHLQYDTFLLLIGMLMNSPQKATRREGSHG